MKPGLSLLVSWAYMARAPDRWCELFARTQHCVNYLFDSGAYSAKVSGHVIELPDYMRFCHYVADHVDNYGYIALDVVQDRDATMVNLQAMLDDGLTPMPVLVSTAPLADVPGLRSINRRLCVAGGATANRHIGWYVKRLNEVSEACGGDVAMHGLGFTKGTMPAMRTPVRTVDSSTWSVGSRYGRILLHHGASGRMGQDMIRDLIEKPWGSVSQTSRDLLTKSGVTVDALAHDRETTRGGMSWAALVSTNEYLRYCTRLRALGVEVFTACSSTHHIELLCRALQVGRPGGGVHWDSVRNAPWRKKVSVRSMAELSMLLIEASEHFRDRSEHANEGLRAHAV